MMGGTLTVKSKAGSGSAFTICVPIKETSQHEAKSDKLAMDKSAAALQSILLVDDNKVICKMISK